MTKKRVIAQACYWLLLAIILGCQQGWHLTNEARDQRSDDHSVPEYDLYISEWLGDRPYQGSRLIRITSDNPERKVLILNDMNGLQVKALSPRRDELACLILWEDSLRFFLLNLNDRLAMQKYALPTGVKWNHMSGPYPAMFVGVGSNIVWSRDGNHVGFSFDYSTDDKKNTRARGIYVWDRLQNTTYQIKCKVCSYILGFQSDSTIVASYFSESATSTYIVGMRDCGTIFTVQTSQLWHTSDELSPSGRYLTAHLDDNINVWDLSEKKKVAILPGGFVSYEWHSALDVLFHTSRVGGTGMSLLSTWDSTGVTNRLCHLPLSREPNTPLISPDATLAVYSFKRKTPFGDSVSKVVIRTLREASPDSVVIDASGKLTWIDNKNLLITQSSVWRLNWNYHFSVGGQEVTVAIRTIDIGAKVICGYLHQSPKGEK